MIKDISSALKALARLDARALFGNRIVRMASIGAIGFLIQSTIFEIVGIQLDLFSPPGAALLGAEIAIVVNFFLNNRFTFANEKIPFSRAMVPKFLKFNAAVALSLAIQWVMVSIGERVGGDWALRLFNVLGVLVGFIVNYISYTTFIWKQAVKEIDKTEI